MSGRKSTEVSELIETLCNVNLTVPQITADSARINRNIVECKFFCPPLRYSLDD